jgi:hypothetical protein
MVYILQSLESRLVEGSAPTPGWTWGFLPDGAMLDGRRIPPDEMP